MSALAYSYSEPNKLPAGILALLVHGAFFSLLYFGVNWHTEQPQGMVVDIWTSLPDVKTAPTMQPAPPPPPPPKIKEVIKPEVVEPEVVEPEVVEPPQAIAPPKADIALPEKKKIEKPKVKEKKKIPKPTVPKISAAEKAARAEQAARQAAAVAAITSEIGKYTGLIRSKIKRFIVRPANIQDDVRAEFDVVLLPGGSVLSTRLVKSSGSTAYDDAVERAIIKSQPLPLPPDVLLFKYFRELHLGFTPVER
ncbi:MAG: energy transducer TonB [Gallionellaceae bacterium]